MSQSLRCLLTLILVSGLLVNCAGPQPALAPLATPSALPPAPTRPPRTPPPLATPLPTASPSPTPIVEVLPEGWRPYQNLAYGFAFLVPPGWKVELDQVLSSPAFEHMLLLQPPGQEQVTLYIGFKRSGETADITRPTPGPGSLEENGAVTFLGKPLGRLLLVERNLERALLYGRGAEIQAGGLIFTLSLELHGAAQPALGLPEEAKAQADSVLASFVLLH